jgi:hypothetical protein
LSGEPYLPRVSLKVSADSHQAQVPGFPSPDARSPKRGKVKGFSKKSRRRMMLALAEIRGQGDIQFATLTYPRAFPASWSTYKGHLHALLKRITRLDPGAGYVWKLEFQKRGAPHFHLILFNFMPHKTLKMRRQWLAWTWYHVVASGDMRHLGAGTQLDPCRNRRHLSSYLTKYVTKDEDQNARSENGRVWGRGGALNVEPYLELELTWQQFVELKRLCRAWLRANRGASGRSYARTLARNPAGFTILGLGMESQGLAAGQTIVRMLEAVGALSSASDPP